MKHNLPVLLCAFSLSLSSAGLTPAAGTDSITMNQFYFLPEMDGLAQPFVGDCMPYYEDGVYYIYYLKESGDSYRHSIYLATTTDFLTYEDYNDPILVSSDSPAQDEWIGTGSVVKVDDTYYLFYTGHTDTGSFEYKETVMLAKGSSLTSFEKVAGWEITPDDSLNQKRDFRDPQGYYDEEAGTLSFTITASQDGVARILKYTVSKDLSEITYDGIIFTDPIGKVYNLECSDTFQIGDTWYLTYSAQDDVLWYASSDEPYGPYSQPQSLDGPLFYAAKHVEDSEHVYMAGWARRSRSERDTRNVSEWAGNLVVQQVRQLPDGSLVLEPVDAIAAQVEEPLPLLDESPEISLSAQDEAVYSEICNAADSFLLEGDFCFEDGGCFGLAFDFKDGEEDYKLISVDPENEKLLLQFRGGSVTPAASDVSLDPGKSYHFRYIQEDSVGVFYIDEVTAFTVRLYGVADKTMYLFAQGGGVTFSGLKMLGR